MREIVKLCVKSYFIRILIIIYCLSNHYLNTSSHSWQTYYYCIYLVSGGDKIIDLSNFEANFIAYLKSLGISRTAFHRLKSDFRHFQKFLQLTLPSPATSQLEKLLTPKIINQFKTWFVKKNHQTKRADQIGEVLEDFRTWLDKKANLYETVASPAENEVLIIEFIDHLVKNNTPKATVSNYKSDLLQFVTYLSRNFKYLPLKECGQKNKIFSEYANYLSYKLQLSESTVKRKLSSLQ